MTDDPLTCQELRCGAPAEEPFDAGRSGEPLIFMLCHPHRVQVDTDRWLARSDDVLLIGQDAVMETPKQVKKFQVRASDWLEGEDGGEPKAFVELEMVIGFATGMEYDEDLTLLIPTDVVGPLAHVLPSLAADAERRTGRGRGRAG